MKAKRGIESPQELANEMWNELCDLLDQGEISREFAMRIAGDIFERERPGEPPRLRWSVWCAHVERQVGRTG